MLSNCAGSPFTLLDTTKNSHISNEQVQPKSFMRLRALQYFPTNKLRDVYFLAKKFILFKCPKAIFSFLKLNKDPRPFTFLSQFFFKEKAFKKIVKKKNKKKKRTLAL